jgi:cytochrome c oxidase cbb3-type subunit III
MPRWWVTTFWATFVFSIGYLLHYHVSGRGQSVEQTYAEEVREQRANEARRALGETITEDSLAALMGDAAMMSDARQIFQDRCAACHADQGQGAIGPNLTDDHWLHGDGSLLAIHRLISDGVPEKGMPPWNRQLNAVELRQLAAFVGSMRGKSLPGKPPEGQKLGAAPAAPMTRHASTHAP